MENIYSYEWRGKRAGWDYKVIFKKSSADEIGTTNEIKLPRGSFKLNKTKWAFDKYRLGLHSAKTLSAQIKMNLLSGSDYDDFVSMLYNPITEITRTIYASSFTYVTGTKIEFWIKFNGNSQESINIWRLQYEGMIREDQEQKQATKDNTFELEFEDILKCALDQGTMEHLRSMFSVDQAERPGYIEYYDNTNKRIFVQMAGPGQTILFQPFTVIETYLETVIQTILRDAKRDHSFTYSLSLPLPKISKQLYAGSCLRGDELNKSEVFVASLIYYGVTPAGGLVDNDDDISLPGKYQSCWDFMVDMYQSNLKIANQLSYEITTFPFCSYNNLVTIDPKKVDVDITRQSMLLKSVTSSLIEIKDGSVGDIGKGFAAVTGSRNANEFTLPIVFNTMPSNGDYMSIAPIYVIKTFQDLEDWLNTFINLGSTGSAWVGFDPRNMGLYYKEKPSFVGNTNGEFFRVHEYPVYIVKPGVDSEDLVGFSAVDMSTDTLTAPNVTIAKFQDKTAVPYITAETLLKVFSDRKQKKAKVSVPVNYQTSFSEGGDIGFAWDDPTNGYTMDLSAVDAREDYNDEPWLPLNCEIDWESEKADLELLMLVI